MKSVIKRIKKVFNNYIFKYIKKGIKFLNKNKHYILKYIHILYMAIPFIIMDVFTRYLGRKIDFFALDETVPNLFTLIWIILILGICFSFKNNKRKIIYSVFILISLTFFLVNNVYYSVTDSFFDFSLLDLASEGSSYMLDSVINADKIIYIVMLLVIAMSIFIIKYMPTRKRNNIKIGIVCFFLFLICHIFIPTFLGDANSDLSWNTWRNPRNIYISFNDNNKSMSLAGLYEYTFRNFYITYIREKKTDNEEEKEFLELVYNEEEANYNTKYTGYFKDINISFLQLDVVDDWFINENVSVRFYSMMNSCFVFNAK